MNPWVGPWEHDGKFTVGIPVEAGVYYFRVPDPALGRHIVLVPELLALLDDMVENIGFENHDENVRALDLLRRARGEA